MLLFAISVASYAFDVPLLQDNKTRRTAPKNPVADMMGKSDDDKTAKDADKKPVVDMAQVVIEDESIPDSLLHPRWKIQRTTPITQADLDRNATDLSMPGNIKQEVVYNDTLNRYYIGSKMGDSYLSTPIAMTPEEYRKWSEKKEFDRFFRAKNDEILKEQGKEKFSFTDMHFDLGPAEKIFGPGGVRIKTQGTAELKFGVTLKEIDNPSLPIRNP